MQPNEKTSLIQNIQQVQDLLEENRKISISEKYILDCNRCSSASSQEEFC